MTLHTQITANLYAKIASPNMFARKSDFEDICSNASCTCVYQRERGETKSGVHKVYNY